MEGATFAHSPLASIPPVISDRLAAALKDRYRIERELGAGGMATVYLAQDLKHDRKVALKVLKPELAAVLGADRFVVEIKTTASMSHPHILPLFDSGTADGFLFYVMPFIEGETLRGKLNRETQLGVDEAVRIAREVADALDYAHRRGVIHRDIKPENILLHDGRPMVADFGIALAVSAAAGGRMTETGLSLGTPHYMSPEQATAEKEISARSDVYSLASVLYEMLAGQPPHSGGSAQQVIMKIITEAAAPVTQLRRSVPPNVAAAVAKALEKLPADRFDSARAFAEALANPAFLGGAADAASGPIKAARGVNRGLVALAAALLAVVAWQSMKSGAVSGPSAYDVGLPDTAMMNLSLGTSFAVSPRGDFAIYQRWDGGVGELWFRSLRDATVRRLDATKAAFYPTIAPNGARFAFIRDSNPESSVEVMPVAGGAATVIARSRNPNSIEWLRDGRILLVEGDGLNSRRLDPDGGPSVDRRIGYCINPSLLPDAQALLCGGGGNKRAYAIDIRDTASFAGWSGDGSDSVQVAGSDFRLIDGKYLVYVSNVGDLMASRADPGTGRVGRSVRMVPGLRRTAYSGAGSYAVSDNGTLVYANGPNAAVGHLVRASERTLDTLPVGRAAFLNFALSPDGRRLASVVEVLDGEEVRIYDLVAGGYVVWLRGPWLRQPVWSPRGDRLAVHTRDSVFVGPPDATRRPGVLFVADMFEGLTWLPDGRLIGTLWGADLVAAAHVDAQPVRFDTLALHAALGRLSPGERWIAYNSRDFDALWLEPLPSAGKRFRVGGGPAKDAQWISPSAFVTASREGTTGYDRVTIDASSDPPGITRRRWIEAPERIDIPAAAFALTPDGRVIFKQGARLDAAPYLRVIPNWVAQMKRAVDEANK